MRFQSYPPIASRIRDRRFANLVNPAARCPLDLLDDRFKRSVGPFDAGGMPRTDLFTALFQRAFEAADLRSRCANCSF
jgi:hypothetical protein